MTMLLDRPSRARGFTLIELILSMSMIAMLTLSMYMGLNTAFRARDSAYAMTIPARSAAVAADFVRQDLESVLPPSPATDAILLAGPFIGTHSGNAPTVSDSMEFCCVGGNSRWDSRPLAEGARRVEYVLRTDIAPAQLVRRVQRNLLANPEPPVEEEVICRAVRSFTVRYWDGYDWQTDWDSTTVGDILPLAVQFTIIMDVTPAPGKAPVTVSVTRTVPLACAKPADTSQTGGIQ